MEEEVIAGADRLVASGKVSVFGAVVPLLKLLSLTVIGLILAHPRFQIAPRATFKLISKLVFALFLPCLIFVQLGQSINLGDVLKWWFIPVNVLASTGVGCALGCAVVLVCRPPPEFARLTVIMTGFGNTGSLSIAVVTSICHGSDHPFGPNCQRNGVAYVSFAQWITVILVYTLVYHIMEPPMDYRAVDQFDVNGSNANDISGPLLPEVEWPGLLDKGNEQSKKPFIARVFLSITGSSINNFPDIDFDEERSSRGGAAGGGGDDSGGVGCSSPKSIRCLAEPRMVRRIRIVAEHTPIRNMLQPPIIASLLAIVVGLVPELKAFVFGKDAPLAFVSDSLAIFAQAVVPFVMLILGGMLVEGPSDSELGLSTIVGISVTRLFILPLFGIGIVSLADKMSFLVNGDRMYQFVLLLQYMSPSAILIGAIASLRGYAVSEASAILFWQHVCALFSLTLYVVIYLKLLA